MNQTNTSLKPNVALTWLWLALILIVGTGAVATLWFPVLSIDALPSKNYNEGWNAYRQWMAVEGQPLYASRNIFWTTNYPPLSFHLVGLLGKARDAMVPAGRAVNFGAFVGVALLLGGVLRRATGSLAAAVFAGLWLVSAFGSFDYDARVTDDPGQLCAFFAMLGVFAYMRSPREFLWPALAAFSFCLCIFTKEDFIAFPLSVAAHLLLTRNWRSLAAFVVTGVIISCGAAAFSIHFDGRYFFSQMLQPRAYVVPHLKAQISHYLHPFFIPLGFGILLLLLGNGITGRWFLFILLVFANVIAVAFSGGNGVDLNIFYPAVIADLLACISGLCWLTGRNKPIFALALVIMTIVGVTRIPSRLRADITLDKNLPAAAASAQQAIGLIKAVDGPVICEDLLLCFEAGKPLDYDPYYVKDQIMIGHIEESSIIALLAAHHYAAIQLDNADDGDWRKGMNLRFTPGVQQALLAAYQPVMISPDDLLFKPSNP